MILIEGNKLKEKIIRDLKEKTKSLPRPIKIAIIQVGENEFSTIYINQKKKLEQEINILINHIKLQEETKEQEIIKKINTLNKDKEIDGIMVQLPLPKHLNQKAIVNAIDENKDIDGLTDSNIIKLYNNNYTLAPCTPIGILKLLELYKIDIKDKNIVILGRSDIVGKPLSLLLTNSNATVTLCHSKTKDVKSITNKASILISAIGKPKLITKNYIKENAIIIDVGINKDENGKLCGDIDFEDVKDKVSYITPVPKGVGPATIAMFLENSYKAYLLNNKKW